ncbi:hypothetical protein AB4027_06330 [Alkalibacterium putridalgicola]|uniref:hypothetical protein n=1 Tax=Alkalibacterium putridalgicola TaxID=426703 RepID=UPI0034CD5978
MLEDSHKFTLLKYVLSQEKETYKLNPTPTAKEINENENKYRRKVNEIVKEIAEKEGLDYENS